MRFSLLLLPALLLLQPLAGNMDYESISSCEKSFFDCPIKVELCGDLGFESRFIYRGSKLAKEVATSSFELTYTEEEFSVYGGAWGAFPARNSENTAAQQINAFFGLSWQADTWFKLDLGYIRYNYTSTDLGSDDILKRNFLNRYSSHQNELYFGARFDTYFCPSFYCFYNFDLKQWVLEPSLRYSFNLFEICKHCVTLDFSLKAGWLHAKAFNGNQRPSGYKDQQNSYFYAQATGDLTLHVSEHLSLSVGPRYVANNDGSKKGVTDDIANKKLAFNANAIDGKSHTFWWGAHLKFNF